MKERPNCHFYLTDIFQVSPSDQRLQRKANFGQIELNDATFLMNRIPIYFLICSYRYRNRYLYGNDGYPHYLYVVIARGDDDLEL